MTTLPEQIMASITNAPGLSDRELTEQLRGRRAPQQPCNQAARNLEAKGLLERKRRDDGLIGNYPISPGVPPPGKPINQGTAIDSDLSEDCLKKFLVAWLESAGWTARVAWGNSRGADIIATRGGSRWVIEVKGIGSRPQMRVNYFIGILGETLQRMDDSDTKYSIALPDVKQFHGLWARLPALAKKRTRITMLFVDAEGRVRELHA